MDKFRKVLMAIASKFGIANDEWLELRTQGTLVQPFVTPALLPKPLRRQIATLVFGKDFVS